MKICLLVALMVVATLADPRKPPMRTTLITAWWPEAGSSEATPQGEDLNALNQLLALPHNLVVYGPKQFGEYVATKRDSKNTQINEVPESDMTGSWHYKRVKELEAQGQTMNWKDHSSRLLAYSRVFLMKWAMDADQFDSD